jgi:hypothetical protein
MMKLSKKCTLGAAVVMALSLSAQADLITFDPTGTAGAAGDITGAGTFDWVPGSSLAVGANTAAGLVAGTSFTSLYQANLGTIQDGVGGTIFTNGGGSRFFTAVAGFGETITTCTGAPCTNATFAFDPTNTTNFFKIYAVSSLANNLTGMGFTTGSAILTGHGISADFGSNFAVTGTSPVNLDQSPNGNQAPGVSTVSGLGSSDTTIVVDSVDANYFPDLLAGSFITFSAFNTSQILPFNQVDPSQCFINTGTTVTGGTTDCAVAAGIGSFNGAPGSGSNMEFQADGNQSFRRETSETPEPETLALLGLGLIGMGAVGRGRKKD